MDYISIADIEHVVGSFGGWAERRTLGALYGRLTEQLVWLDVPMKPVPEDVDKIADVLCSGDAGINRVAQILFQGLGEDLRIMHGSEAPTEIGREHETITAFGELNGHPVLGVKKDGKAGMVYQGAEKILCEGEITEIGVGPDNGLVCILNNQLFHGGQPITGDGDNVTSLRAIPGGDRLVNPFVFDNKLAYVKTEGNARIIRDACIVIGDEEHQVRDPLHTCKLEGADGRLTVGYHYKEIARDPAAGKFDHWETKNGSVDSNVGRLAQYSSIYRRAMSIRPVNVVKGVGVLGGKPAYLLEVFPEESIKERKNGELIIKHDWPSKHILVQHTKCHQGYPVETLDLVRDWASEHIPKAGREYAAPGFDRIEVRSTDKMSVEGIMEKVERFKKQYLIKQEVECLDVWMKDALRSE
jgi:hypothetical protein